MNYKIPIYDNLNISESSIYIFYLLYCFDIDNDGILKYSLETISSKMPEHIRLEKRQLINLFNELIENKLVKRITSESVTGVNEYEFYILTNEDKFIWVSDHILFNDKLSIKEIVNYIELKKLSDYKGGKFTIILSDEKIYKKLKISRSTWQRYKKSYIEQNLLNREENKYTLTYEFENYKSLKQKQINKKVSKNISGSKIKLGERKNEEGYTFI